MTTKYSASARAASGAQILLGIAAALALLYFLRQILIPFVIAFVLVVLVDALDRKIRHRWPSAPSALVSALGGLMTIAAAAAGIFILARGALRIVGQGPALLVRIDTVVEHLAQSLRLSGTPNLTSMFDNVEGAQVVRYLLSAVQGPGGTILLIVIYFGFLLFGRQRISRKLDVVARSSDGTGSPAAILERIAADIRTYIWIQAVTGAMITAAAAAVMVAVGLDNVLFWTVVIFLLSFIPNIGVTVGSIAPALFALLQFRSEWQSIVIFAVIQVAAFVVGNVIYPQMQAKSQNIDPVVTILALSFWSLLWGIAGAFLAVPLTLMVMMALAQFDNSRWIAALLSNDGHPKFQDEGH